MHVNHQSWSIITCWFSHVSAPICVHWGTIFGFGTQCGVWQDSRRATTWPMDFHMLPCEWGTAAVRCIPGISFLLNQEWPEISDPSLRFLFHPCHHFSLIPTLPSNYHFLSTWFPHFPSFAMTAIFHLTFQSSPSQSHIASLPSHFHPSCLLYSTLTLFHGFFLISTGQHSTNWSDESSPPFTLVCSDSSPKPHPTRADSEGHEYYSDADSSCSQTEPSNRWNSSCHCNPQCHHRSLKGIVVSIQRSR
jgi:hypothetical protein